MIKVDNFVVKLRAYPNAEQREKIDRILYGLRVAYNVTAYEITKGNPMITKQDANNPETRWPDFKVCRKKEWLNWLRENYNLSDVPAIALSASHYSIFEDMNTSWSNFHPEIVGKQKKTKKGKPIFKLDGTPVWEKTEKPVKLPCGKWKPEYYSNKKPRESFTVQSIAHRFVLKDKSKSVYIPVTNLGMIKVRGWRYDLKYGDNQQEFLEYFSNKDLFPRGKALSVTLSKDNCGDYWIIVYLQTVWMPDKSKAEKKSIGIDVGIKDIAITSDGSKYENQHFRKKEKNHKRIINKKVSRRQGWSNATFRELHKADKSLQPSKGYIKAKLKLSKLEKKIARKRQNYNNVVTADIVTSADFIGIESLNVKGMMSNHRLADALSDAAMYDVLSRIKYKAERYGVPVVEIGKWEPSSQLCSNCGYKNVEVKNLSVRSWTCPKCGETHDRDVNAAKNILAMARKKKKK